MKVRSIGALVVSSWCALAACEDGPTQTYRPQPAPTGGGGSYVSPGNQGYWQGSGYYGCDECVCPQDLEVKRDAWLVAQPILLPNRAAGIDIAGGVTWGGLTIDDAERYNGGNGSDPGTIVTPGTPQGGMCFGTRLPLAESWSNGAITVDYAVATRKIETISLASGYLGTLKAITPTGEGKDIWEIGIEPNAVKKNGVAVTIDWSDRSFGGAFNQIYRAVMTTFGASYPLEPIGTTCFDTGRCIVETTGSGGSFSLPLFGFTLFVDDVAHHPTTPARIDLQLAKVMAYAFADPMLKMDGEGPIARAGALLAGKPECTLRMGVAFDAFLADCVETTGDGAKDKGELNKLLGELKHDTQRFFFGVDGAELGFTHTTLADDTIVLDTDVPAPKDVAQRFVVDEHTLGRFANDHVGNDPSAAIDLHGFGAVQAETARLAREELLARAKITDGDTSRCVFPVGWASDPSFDRKKFWDGAPAYCTGLEAWITARAPSGPGDRTNLGYAVATSIAPGGLKSGLKPGHPKLVMCDDANGDALHGYASCIGGDVLPTAFARVVQIFAKGDVKRLPNEARDARFFFQAYARAFAKYLKIAADPTRIDLSSVTLGDDDVRFDATSATIVDRTTDPPTTFTLTGDATSGLVSSYAWDRTALRGEEVVLAATAKNPLLTNTFGSPLLASAWTPSSDGHPALYCATHLDPAHCDGQICPLDPSGAACAVDALGRPILQAYAGAFTPTVLALGTSAPSLVTIVSTSASLQSATIDVPLFTDPYDPTSPPLDPMKRLVPWVEKQPGVGFPVAVNGGVDRLVSTTKLDLSGTTMRAVLDVDVHIDATTHKPDKDARIDLRAAESTGFLGEIFLCQDPASGDLMRARMSTVADDLLDWLGSHPAAYDACGIVVRYSSFGTDVESMTSLANGVRVDFTRDTPARRVRAATLFVPGQ